MTDVYFDLDGVIRDLNKEVYGYVPKRWNERVKGLTFIDRINTDMDILCTAPPTKYYKVIKKLFPKPKIATVQFKHWLSRTEPWIAEHFDDAIVKVFEHGNDKYEYVVDHKKAILVEDSPALPSYKNVILIDYPYNRHINAEMRVKTAKQLEGILKGIMDYYGD